MNGDRWLRLADRLFAWLLCVYPRRFRDRYADDMVRMFRLRSTRAARERGAIAAAWTCARGLADLAASGLIERALQRRPSTSISTAAARAPGAKGDTMVSRIAQNLGYGWRTCRRQPGFAFVLIATLALGTGATITLFSIVDAALVRPLAYPDADRLVSLLQRDARSGLVPFAAPYLPDLRERTTSYSHVVGFSPTWEMTLTGAGEPGRVPAAFVSDHLLAITGIGLARGRDFLPEEHKAGGAPAALVTRRFWDRIFGPDVPLNGQVVRLDDKPFAIVGIVADPARLPVTTSSVSADSATAQVWIPLVHNPFAQVRSVPVMNVMARLKPGITVAQAEAELQSVGRTLHRETGGGSQRADFAVIATADLISRDSRRIVLVLFGAALCLLLIACVNAANLLLARSSARQQELQVRAALGASRGRIVEQLLTESLLFAAAGSLGGLLLAWWLLSSVPALGIGNLPPTAEIGIDLRVASFAVLLTVMTTALFALAPAWLSSKGTARVTLREGSRTIGGSSRASRALVVVEAALALTLLIGAGLLSRSLWQLTNVPTGFQAEGVLGIPIALPESRYATAAARRIFFTEALGRLAGLPGVQRVAAVNRIPLGGSNVLVGMEIEGQPSPAGEQPAMDRRVSFSGYFDLMDIPIVRGRDFQSVDEAAKAERVAIVNEMAVRRYWGGGDALGRRMRLMLRSGPGPWLTIVGVVGNVRHHQLDRPPQPEVYVPYAQASVESMVVLLRTEANPAARLPEVKAAIWALDRDLPFDGAGPLDDLLFDASAQHRFRALVLGAFATLALGLAAIGIYGVMSYSVTRRNRDIGVRVALGAQSRDIFRLILGEGLMLTAVGLAAGVAASLVLSRMLAGLLFGVTTTDPLTFAGATAVLLLVALVASYLPARRAARLDPLTALRLE
jgi:putative ABC transport system permease protein